jgi:hypothetical protein
LCAWIIGAFESSINVEKNCARDHVETMKAMPKRLVTYACQQGLFARWTTRNANLEE